MIPIGSIEEIFKEKRFILIYKATKCMNFDIKEKNFKIAIVSF